MLSLIVAATIVLFFLAATAYLASIFNHLVALKNVCDKGFVQLETRLRQRDDLVRDFVDRGRGSLRNEPKMLESVMTARNEAWERLSHMAQDPGNAATVHAWAVAEERLADELGRLRLKAENVAEFTENSHLAELIEELSLAEKRVAYTRHAYNDWVLGFNAFREAVPNIYVACCVGFSGNRPLLEVMESAPTSQVPVAPCV